ncbi:MAG: 50S ribosomal protein L1 [Phycisphaerae bacterium]|jgi:large subunit ribosomal protein L1|nr:50S ribosomal protein L1 [Phycisphaerae bacterium]MCZ2401272.1 50S ribosomal protein L1 [Phycisphaerae bacterium]NUQ49808.1 50S ribosomal protein L1 [Phycisphaerae bacterium]
MQFRSKRYRKDVEKQPRQALRTEDAVRKLKEFSKPKFDPTVNIVCHLGIDPKQADQMIRGSVSLPKGIGKSKRVIAFCPETEIERAKAAGAIEAGADELVEKVSKGWMDFDVAIAHPSMMGKIAKLGRVLGPQGKMPSPKSGTVTAETESAVKEYSAGKVEFRNDAGGNVHAVVGKLSFADSDLKENIDAFVEHIRRLKPTTSKGLYLKRVCISATMTPSVTLDTGAAVTEA